MASRTAKSPIQPIITTSKGRVQQLELGVGENQQARASDFNAVSTWINSRSAVNASTGTAGGSATACTITINDTVGAFTTVGMTAATTVAVTVTVTDSSVSANSLILAQITGFSGTWETNGAPVITSIIPSAGSFIINITNVSTNTMTAKTISIKFIVL